MGCLARHPDRVLVGARVVPPDVAAGLHRIGNQALVDEALANDDLRVGESLVGSVAVADRPVEDDVVGSVLVELRRAGLRRLLGVDHGRQRVVIDLDRGERIRRLLGRIRDDGGHAFAGPFDAVRREDAWGVDVVLESRRAAGRPGHRQRVVWDVGAGDDGQDARHRLRRRDVDGFDVRVGIWAAQDGDIRHPRELDVVQVAARACDKALVFSSLDRSAEDLRCHRIPS